MKTYRRSGGTEQLNSFLISALNRRHWSASCPVCFTSRNKSPWFPLKRRWGWPQSRSVHYGETKISCACWIQTPDLPAHGQVIVLTVLSWLHKNYAVALNLNILILLVIVREESSRQKLLPPARLFLATTGLC
jgi:hypothetical protein